MFDQDKLPGFHDPFAGGGTLPLEAQRLGLEAYASDLYPELPRTDRLRFLRAYLERVPELSARRRELVDAVAVWVRARLADWSRRDRSESLRYPLAPRG